MDEYLAFMEQLDDASKKGEMFVKILNAYDKAIALSVIATVMDKYCIENGYDVREEWKGLVETADAVHDLFND